MAPPEPLTLTRRRLLLGAAGAIVLAGCGGGSGSAGDGAGGGDADGAGAAGLGIAEYFDRNQVVAGREVRLPIGLVGPDGVTMTDVPREVSVAVAPAGGAPGPATTVSRHDADLPRPYYPVRATLPAAGTWELVVTTADGTARSPLSAVATQAVPGPGDRFPALATPTVDDARGVDPICTAEPPCPLHATSADAALAAGRPLALLVSTPAFCATGICGPVLEVLEDAVAAHPAVTFVHAEVYADRTATRTAPAVDALGLTYEPALFMVGGDGRVVDRLDVIFDSRELGQVLARLT